MIENLHISNSLSDQGLEQGVAGFPKDVAQGGERPIKGRRAEEWMARTVVMSFAPSESTPRKELSSDDKRLMVDLISAWQRLKGRYKVPIELALDQMKNALQSGENSINILAGYSKTGAPLLDPSKANMMLDEIRKSIVTNPQLSGRLSCGATDFDGRYRFFTVTIVKAGV